MFKAKLLLATIVTSVTFAGLVTTPAAAHQPVTLLDSDTTAARGPLLLDGTISFAVRASFNKAGQKKAFRAGFKSGDLVTVQYLIVDQRPENALRTSALPQISITSPKGKTTILKINERTKFYEPFGKTNYLFLSRYSTTAEAGIYSITITSRGRAAITIAVGDKEVPGEVLRGPAPTQSATSTPTPTPIPTPTPTPTTTPTPTPTPTKSASGYTMSQVKANNSASSCWSVIEGDVYDLTRWISSHPGGAAAIRSLCGIDGTSAFNAQHEGQRNPANRLAMYRLGPLAK